MRMLAGRGDPTEFDQQNWEIKLNHTKQSDLTSEIFY